MATVKVACKLPNGLTVDHADGDGKVHSFTLNGANHDRARFGYGVTDVDADVFNAWAGQHGDFKPLKNGLIFKTGKDDEGATRERGADATVTTGAEPLDPSKPAPGVQPTEEQTRELAKLPADPAASVDKSK